MHIHLDTYLLQIKNLYIYIYRSFCSKYLELIYTCTPTGTTQTDMSSQPCLRNKYASHHGVHHGLIGCRHHSSFPQIVSRAQPSAKTCGVEKNTSPYPLTVLLENFLLWLPSYSEFINILEYPELTYMYFASLAAQYRWIHVSTDDCTTATLPFNKSMRLNFSPQSKMWA